MQLCLRPFRRCCSTNLSCLTVLRVVPAARKGKVTVEDLPLPEQQQAEPAFEEFQVYWDKHVEESKATGKAPSLMKVRYPEMLGCG